LMTTQKARGDLPPTQSSRGPGAGWSGGRAAKTCRGTARNTLQLSYMHDVGLLAANPTFSQGASCQHAEASRKAGRQAHNATRCTMMCRHVVCTHPSSFKSGQDASIVIKTLLVGINCACVLSFRLAGQWQQRAPPPLNPRCCWCPRAALEARRTSIHGKVKVRICQGV